MDYNFFFRTLEVVISKRKNSARNKQSCVLVLTIPQINPDAKDNFFNLFVYKLI